MTKQELFFHLTVVFCFCLSSQFHLHVKCALKCFSLFGMPSYDLMPSVCEGTESRLSFAFMLYDNVSVMTLILTKISRVSHAVSF